MVMQPTHFWNLSDRANLRPLDWSWHRTIHVQRPMRTPVMIVMEVFGQEPPQMALVQDDHMVQAVAANTPNKPLDIRILPRTPGGDHNLLNPHMLDPLPKGCPVDPVLIAQEIPRGLVPWEGINDLLGGPRRRGMCRDVAVDDTTPMVGQDDQDKEYFVGHRWHDKEIQGHQILDMVLQEGLPRRGWWLG